MSGPTNLALWRLAADDELASTHVGRTHWAAVWPIQGSWKPTPGPSISSMSLQSRDCTTASMPQVVLSDSGARTFPPCRRRTLKNLYCSAWMIRVSSEGVPPMCFGGMIPSDLVKQPPTTHNSTDLDVLGIGRRRFNSLKAVACIPVAPSAVNFAGVGLAFFSEP